MKYIFSFGTVMILALLMAGCSSSSKSSPPPPPPAPEIVEINIEPPIVTLDVGTSEHYQAIARDDEGTISDVSDQVLWSLENDNGTVELSADIPGLALAKAIGTDNVVATLGLLSTTSAVTVIDEVLDTLVVSPAGADLIAGTEETFSAMGAYIGGRTQDLTDESDWLSEAPGTVSITQSGVATAVVQGETRIFASFAGVESNRPTVVVHDPVEIQSIEVTPQDVHQFVDSAQAYTATAHFTDGTSDIVTYDVLWRSDNIAVAALTLGAGYFKIKAAGNAEITANYSSNISGASTLIVEDVFMTHIEMVPQNATVEIEETRRYFTEIYNNTGEAWSVNQLPEQSYSIDDDSVAYISNNPNSKGILTGLKVGQATVTSTFIYQGVTYSDEAIVTVTE